LARAEHIASRRPFNRAAKLSILQRGNTAAAA
jgi:hypothetical protein